MTAHALEALSNTVGEAVVENWTDFASCHPMVKLRLINGSLDGAVDWRSAAWSEMRWLYRFRDRLLEARSERLQDDVFCDAEAREETFGYPKSAIEREVTHKRALRAYQAVFVVAETLANAMQAEKRLGMNAESWYGSYTVRRPELG
jgi:hypothetical protein